MNDFEGRLSEISAKGLSREVFSLPSPGGKFTIDGRDYLNFSSNDYLNLACDERVKKASIAAVEKYGAGSGGSRLMCGTLPLHGELENALAQWFGDGAAVVFGSGFLANLGVISSLAGRGDSVFFDRLDHASLIDGILLSRASWKRFAHNDMAALEEMLKAAGGNKFIIVDSVFSMDGDFAPVKKLGELADKYGAFLMVDEAHAIGVFGGGRGICAMKNVKADLITGTFSKAFGGYGGFAVCSDTVKKLLINTARPFIFSTSLPPAVTGGALKALEIIREEKDMGARLISNSGYFHGLLAAAGLNLPEFSSQIIPVIIGGNEEASKAASLLWEEGIYARAVRPPTVPQNTARLRLSVTLAHERASLSAAAGKIAAAVSKAGKV
jgi:8-amino-7-oxononanoate synthase